MFNPTIIFELQNKWKKFTKNHPKFPMFMQAISQTKMNPGTVVEFKVTTAEGQELCSNVKLTEEDIAMFHDVAELMRKMQ